jgi:phosphoribosylformylglycinamidine synthase
MAARAVASLVSQGLVRSAHDCSEGGLAVAIAEMLIGGSTPERPLGAEINLGALSWRAKSAGTIAAALFAETPSRYVLEIRPADVEMVNEMLGDVPRAQIGRLTASGRLEAPLAKITLGVEDLAAAWRGTLDW